MDERDGLLATRAQRARTSLADASARHPVPTAPQPTGHRAARGLLVRGSALAGLAAVMVAVGVLVAVSWRGQPVPRTDVMSTVSAGQLPTAVVVEGGTAYVADAGTGAVTAYDTTTLTPRWTAKAASRPVALAVGDGAVWVLDAGTLRLVRLDPSDGHEVASARTSLDPVGVAITGTTVWVLARGNHTLDKYDASPLAQFGSVDVPAGATSVTAGGGFLWVASPGQLERVALDATRGTGVLSIPLGQPPSAVAASRSVVWVAVRGGELLGLDPQDPSHRLVRVATDGTPTAATVLWDGSAVVATTAGSLTRVSPTGSPSRLPSPGTALPSLSWAGDVLVGVSPQTALLYATEVTP